MNDPDPDRTEKLSDAPPADGLAEAAPVPREIGRYRVEKPIGQGGFGFVYLAYDDQLQRPVAIKVPHARRIARSEDADEYLREARTVAQLDHPNIVPVHDVGGSDEFPCYVVSKYIEGGNLAQRMAASRLSQVEAVQLIATVAEALHYAHTRGVIHRDIKPGNILIDVRGTPYVADFGLALRDVELGKGPRFAGTPSYMSPEQARGEGHRVDGRSDIFSLGVVFYELLVRQKPFVADTQSELLELIAAYEPRPPRQLVDKIPHELERICLRALAKRASERYTTAKDMADDLRHFLARHTAAGGPDASADTLATDASASGAVTTLPHAADATPTDSDVLKIVPKGLRSFDAHDADFFLDLVPGPRDRDGLPESLRFWKTRIEETDAESTFAVGLIYGPSGCGKSSLVKAGLLPRVASHVIPIYIEATPNDTETRLLNTLRKRCPGLDATLSLKDALATLRRGQGFPAGQKVLIVLDQFEQWLHAGRDERESELVPALRHCDGGNVQCIVMVRDDFWMAATRFMRELEIRLLEGQNSAAVDLFDIDHARKVLAAFGRAFGRLPAVAAETTPEQDEFLQQAVAGLAEEGKVVSVRLALFAEMMKGRPWTPATLKQVGGTAGVGAAFLEETFSATTAPPEHRYHQKAARAVLQALLPASGTGIKGHMRSYEVLLEASGYRHRPREFDELIQLLDSEIRLITPTDPAGLETQDDPPASGQKHYQLTHDYLVPSLREWLNRKQRETRRGRAELQLAERAAAWHAKPENRHLPNWLEYVSIWLFTQRKNWTEPQRRMMRGARWYHGLRWGTALVVLLAVGFGLQLWVSRLHAKNLVAQLMRAKIDEVPKIVTELDAYRDWVDDDLRARFRDSEEDSPQKLHASLALLLADEGQIEYLRKRLLNALPGEVPVIARMLAEHVTAPRRDNLEEALWSVLERPQGSKGPQRLRAACGLAALGRNDKRFADVRDDVAAQLVSVSPAFLGNWMDSLRPLSEPLLPALVGAFEATDRTAGERTLAASVLADYAKEKPDVLVRLVLSADETQFPVLFPVLASHGTSAVKRLVAELAVLRAVPPKATELQKDQRAKRRANAAVALVRLGQADSVWPVLGHRPDPRQRSYLIHRFAPLGAGPQTLIKRLDAEQDPGIRQALLLSLGEFPETALSLADRQALIPRLLQIYEHDADAGVHGAADWLLRMWQQEQKVNDVDKKLAADYDQRRPRQGESSRRWFVNRLGQTFSQMERGTFLMGSPPTESERQPDEAQHEVRLTYRFAIAAKEVTVAEYRQFQRENRDVRRFKIEPWSPDADCPVVGVDWFDAVRYCNWLSRKDGIPADQWCYVPDEASKEKDRLKPAADFLTRRGYRLPTEAEWEYACRSGTLTAFSFGTTEELLGDYCWYLHNEGRRTRPVGTNKPNPWGLFDMHGNVIEWCNDWYHTEYYESESSKENPTGPPGASLRVGRGGGWVHAAGYCRSAVRRRFTPGARNVNCGFRLAAVQ